MEQRDDDIVESKSARKREMHHLQELAETLVRLPESQLERIVMPDELRVGVVAARRMQRGALRRQLRFLGRLIDERADATALRAAVDALLAPGRAEVARHHRLERWRERLLAEGEPAAEAFVAEHPAAERQHLKNLLRAARRAFVQATPVVPGAPPGAAQATAARASRALFRYLRECQDGA